MANKLGKVGTLAAMFAKKCRSTRSRTPPKHDRKPCLHIYENARSASPYNTNSSPFKRVFPRSVFRGMQIGIGENLRKIEENIVIFHDFPLVFCTLKAKYMNKYGLIKVLLFTGENSPANSQKVCRFSSLVLYVLHDYYHTSPKPPVF